MVLAFWEILIFLFCYANENMWLLQVLIGPDKLAQDKMAELAK